MTQNVNIKEIWLPLEAAVVSAAKQNFERDTRQELLDPNDTWESCKDQYLADARKLLEEHGENFKPEFEDHALIHVSKE